MSELILMADSYCIFENSALQEKLEVKAPLQSLVNIEELKREIGTPSYVDLSNFQMMKAVLILWASKHPDRFIEGATSEPLRVALFGGGAFKLHCPSANKGSFSRQIGDIDLATSKKNGKLLVKVLCNLAEKSGSKFFHGITSADKRFNGLRGGTRYRVHTIKDIDEEGAPIGGLADIFCDRLTFCHTIDVREELNEVGDNFFTIGLENLIISKTQLIKSVVKDEVTEFETNRILAEFDKKHLLIGMEIKDMQDLAAALYDHDLGDGVDKINVDILGRKLQKDWGMWKTVTMNLKNMWERPRLITDVFGADKEQLELINEKLAKIIEQLNGKYAAKRNFTLTKQWWEGVEEQVL